MEQEVVKKERSKAVTLVRGVLTAEGQTFAQLRPQLPSLVDGQISMSLCYLLRRDELVKTETDRVAKYGRKKIYTYALKANA